MLARAGVGGTHRGDCCTGKSDYCHRRGRTGGRRHGSEFLCHTAARSHRSLYMCWGPVLYDAFYSPVGEHTAAREHQHSRTRRRIDRASSRHPNRYRYFPNLGSHPDFVRSCQRERTGAGIIAQGGNNEAICKGHRHRFGRVCDCPCAAARIGVERERRQTRYSLVGEHCRAGGRRLASLRPVARSAGRHPPVVSAWTS